MNNDDYREAFIPFPNFKKLVYRKLGKPKGKLQVEGYQFKVNLENPNFGLIYNLLPDVYVPEELLPERGREDFKKSLNNKFLWFRFILKKFQPRGNNHLRIFLPNGYHSTELTAVTVQPLIVGLGEASPYETGITLDYLTGLPIIPGSALKGITRRAAIMKLTGKTDILPYGEEFKKLADKVENSNDPEYFDFKKIFGTQKQKGKVIFMDAYPIEWIAGDLFRLDVMNPHYGPYYENPSKNPPADWYNPVPIFYLTVNAGVTYRFILASEDKTLLGNAGTWLEYALQNIGIGAKGNQGYGVFSNIKEVDHDQNTD